MTGRWPAKFKIYWCVVDSRGTAYLSTARITKAKAIDAWRIETDNRAWGWWRRAGYSCQRCDIKVRAHQ